MLTYQIISKLLLYFLCIKVHGLISTSIREYPHEAVYPVFVFLWRIVDVSVTIVRCVRISMGGVHTSVSSRDLGESFDEDEWYTTQCQEHWVYHHMDEAERSTDAWHKDALHTYYYVWNYIRSV